MIKKDKDNILVSRRQFLKKAAYKTPEIIALGTLMVPASAAPGLGGSGGYGGNPMNSNNSLNQTNTRVKPTK